MRNGQFVNRGVLLTNKLTCSGIYFYNTSAELGHMCVNPFYILCLLVSSGFLKELSDRDDFDDKKIIK